MIVRTLVCFLVLVRILTPTSGRLMNQRELNKSNELIPTIANESTAHLDGNESFTISKLELYHQKRITPMITLNSPTPKFTSLQTQISTPIPQTPPPTFCPLSLGFILLYGDCRRKEEQQFSYKTTPPQISPKPAIIIPYSHIQPSTKTSPISHIHQQIIPDTSPPQKLPLPAINEPTTGIPRVPKTITLQTKLTPKTPYSASSTRIQPSTPNFIQHQTLTTKFPDNIQILGIRYHVYDKHKNMSREVKCFNNFVYRNGKCMLSNSKNEIKLIATLSISLLQNSKAGNEKYYSYVSWLHLIIATHFSDFKLATVLGITIFQSKGNSMLYRANVKIVIFPEHVKKYISKQILFFHDKTFSMESSKKRPSIPRHSDKGFLFQFVSNNQSLKGFKMKMQTKFTNFHTTSKLLTYPFQKTLFCPMVVLGKDEIIFRNNSQLCLITIDICFDRMLYYVGDSVQVCMEDYFSKLEGNSLNFSKLERKDIWVYRYTPEGILSLVLMCVSSLSLLITVSIYFICPELRSLPGKCIMFLSSSLLIAQLLFQFGITLNDYPVACKVAGFVVHYAWLASFFWMSASSIQMFLQFGRFVTRQSPNSLKRLLKYCLYAFGCPFLFIATNIGYSLVSSDGNEYGYGLDLCYISYPIMAIITFITPAFLVTVINIILFFIVCCRIGNHENVQSVKSQLNKSKVIMKLSCLTGSLWIVGFVNYFLRLIVLEYVFILLNASQGVFIFVSFICTKRVFSMLRQKFQCFGCKNTENFDNSQQTSF